jgi:hypothetical protein
VKNGYFFSILHQLSGKNSLKWPGYDDFFTRSLALDESAVSAVPVKDFELIPLAQSRATRSLTTEECRQCLHLDACPDAQ